MYKQSHADFMEHLRNQALYLSSSAVSYDNGFLGEAVRMAVAVRILVHDTGRATSLLSSLGKKGIFFYDSSTDLSPVNLLSEAGLTVTEMFIGSDKGTGSRYVAFFDTPRPGVDITKRVGFKHWWEKPVIKDSHGNVFTRCKLILDVANKEGGAHIDPQLDQAYAELSRFGSMGWRVVITSESGESTESEEENSPIFPSIRQMAHEVLKTLREEFPDLEVIVPTRDIIAEAKKSSEDRDSNPQSGERPPTITREFTIQLAGREDSTPEEGPDFLFGEPTSETYRALFTEVADQIRIPIVIQALQDKGLSDYHRENGVAIIRIKKDLPPAYLEYEAAYGLLSAVQETELWPNTGRKPGTTTDSPEAVLGSNLASLVRGQSVRERLIMLGFDPSYSNSTKNANLRRLVEETGVPTVGSPIFCLFALGYALLAMVQQNESWGETRQFFEMRVADCAKKGRRSPQDPIPLRMG